ncbi:unnamed protein product, partial [Ceratitis capitata]
VYADQKYQAKKKTGGGPYKEVMITQIDGMIIEAALLKAAVEGNLQDPTFGRSHEDNDRSQQSVEAILLSNSSDVSATSRSKRKTKYVSERS